MEGFIFGMLRYYYYYYYYYYYSLSLGISMDSSLLLRLKKEGYEISLNPRGEGRCFFHAAAF